MQQYLVHYITATKQVGSVTVEANSPQEAKTQVNYMLSADLGGHATKAEIAPLESKEINATEKLSSLLDDIANRLEAKGLVKQAYEVDVVANTVEIKLASAWKNFENELRGLYPEIPDLEWKEIMEVYTWDQIVSPNEFPKELNIDKKLQKLWNLRKKYPDRALKEKELCENYTPSISGEIGQLPK